jgi:2-oxoglutarate ferredoxin oxidoreductase subunit delta
MGRGMIVVDAECCKGCGLCTQVCPVHILSLSEGALNPRGYRSIVVTDMESCTGCASCATICPDVVFTVYRRKREPATAGSAGGETR